MHAIDRFISKPDVRDRHDIVIHAPAGLVMDVATQTDVMSSRLIRAIFWLRGRILGDTPVERRPQGVIAETLTLGWGMLEEVPGREIVVGGVCQPWQRDVTFRAIPAADFAAFHEPDLVKIVWTLEAEPLGPTVTRFRTETRVEATDSRARRKFRRYWRVFAPGVLFIRWSMLRSVRQEAEQLHRKHLRETGQAA